ncbi:TonB-dependent receptor [Polyangium sp. 15x6]|uniref:TonB-dependent receptor domain-containing protein n=1 Tax=Polyangium sp. 15x6 TaxID=3042687 RepID=UPI00249AFF28|nr:TonB-dependent receptor [Polyangium sp. 15x6]MDI3282928.1 TonB-dependent receptor [Polyangium sp. 15x6]
MRPRLLFPSSLLLLAWLVALPARAHDEVTPPAPKSQPAPTWPEGRAEAHDVIVPLLITVGPDGRAVAIEVEASVSPAFDAEAIRAAAQWTFEPARRGGTAVKARIRMIARFEGVAAVSPDKPADKPAPGLVDPPSHPHPHPPPPPRPIAVTVRGEGPPRSASEVVQRRDVLAAAPHRTASDLLRVVPGVFITQHGGQGKAHQIFLRGFDAAHGQDLELRVAGAPVNEVSNIHGQGYADLHFVMPEVVKSVRAKAGPYDPRQGDFAVAGTIEMDLGLAETGFSSSPGLGTYGERRLFLAYRPAGTTEATFGAFEAQSTDGFGPSRAARRASAIAQHVFPISTSLSARVMASAYAARFSSAGVLRQDDVERGLVDRFATYDARQGGDSTRIQVVLSLDHDDENGKARFSFTPYFVARGLRLRANYTGFLLDPIDGDSQQQINEATTFGLSTHYHRKTQIFSPEDALEIGVQARGDSIEQSQRRLSVVTDRVMETLVDAHVRAADVAGYVDASLRPLRRVVIRGGVRVDGLFYGVTDLAAGEGAGAARAAMGARMGGKATVDVTLLPGLHAVASYGDGFRSPQARTLGDGERTPFTTVRSFEAGLRYADGDRMRANLAVFHTRLSDDLVFDEKAVAYERVHATQRTGFSLDFVLRPRAWIVESGSVTYTRASFTEAGPKGDIGSLVPYTPQLVARTDIALTPRLARLFSRDLVGKIGVGLAYLGVRPLRFAEFGRDIFLADATIGARLREVEIELDVYNLLDAKWYDGQFTYASSFTRGAASSLVPLDHVTVGAPLTLMGTLSLHL